MISTIISAMCVLAALGIFFVTRSEKKAIRARFTDRKTISREEFLTMLDNAKDLESYVEQALKELSSIFGVEQGKIRPDDRFDREFSPARGSEFDSPLATLRLEIAHNAKKHGIKLEEIKIDTVRDYVAFVQRIANLDDR